MSERTQEVTNTISREPAIIRVQMARTLTALPAQAQHATNMHQVSATTTPMIEVGRRTLQLPEIKCSTNSKPYFVQRNTNKTTKTWSWPYLVQRKQKDKDVVGCALGKPVKPVESMAGERGGDEPFVVGLVQVAVEERQVQPPVDPVDAAVNKHQEQEDGGDKIRHAIVVNVVVQPAVPSHLCVTHVKVYINRESKLGAWISTAGSCIANGVSVVLSPFT